MAPAKGLLVGLAVLAAAFAAPPAASADDAKVKELVARLPAANLDDALAVAKELAGMGPPAVKSLAAMLLEPGKGDDVKVRYALHAMATYVSRPGGQADLLAFSEAVGEELRGNHPAAAKGFLIRQLGLAAGPEAVSAIRPHLADPGLCEYATEAIVAAGGPGAAEALRAALSKAGPPCRATLIRGLSVLGDRQAAPLLEHAMGDADRDVRIAAAGALAGIGDPTAAPLLVKAADAADPYERVKAIDAALVLAERLLGEKKTADADAIYSALFRRRAAPGEEYVRIAALRGLAATRGEGAIDDLIDALRSGDPGLRAAAVEIATSLPGEGVTAKWVAMMKDAGPEDRGRIVGILVVRRDPPAAAAVLKAIGDPEEVVRRAAAAALVRMAGGRETSRAIAAAIPAQSDALARKALLDVLAARAAVEEVGAVLAASRDTDAAMRASAVKALGVLGGPDQLAAIFEILKAAPGAAERQAAEDAMLAIAGREPAKAADFAARALGRADEQTAIALLHVLGRAGGPKALAAVRSGAADKREPVQDAAVRVLADWPDASAAGDLLGMARTSENPAQQAVALQGYVRLARGEDDQAKRLAMLGNAMAAAKRPEEKRETIGACGDLQIGGALALLGRCLDDPALREDAAAAALKVARKVAGSEAVRREVLEKVLRARTSEPTRREAADLLGMDVVMPPAGPVEER